MQENKNIRKLGMTQKISFLCQYYGEWQARKLYTKIKEEKLRSKIYAGKEVLEGDIGNVKLINMIQQGEPFMAGRLGSLELAAMSEVLRSECLNKRYDFRRLEDLNRNAGFTEKKDKDYWNFAWLMIESMKYCDLLGVWYNQMENWFCRQYMPQESVLTHRYTYDFWNYSIPFTSALEGKKVLIIHPYEESIRKQYQRREKIYPNTNILPQFELQIVKAVQTIGNHKDERFHSWFEALEYMYNEAMQKDFDVALIGCGAYGFPLAAKLKASGKMAIHMGGVLQILFGIKGKRWDVLPDIASKYNEYWIRPNENETVDMKEQIEGGCYW